jgi:glutamate racemase
MIQKRRMKKAPAILGVMVLSCLFFGFLTCVREQEQPASKEWEKFQLISEIKHDKKSPFYVDFENYPSARNNLPIGVFDSGTGGLTVLDAIMKMDRYNNQTRDFGSDGIPDFASERFIYLADKANMPYGRYDSEGKSDFLKELVLKDVQFLLGNSYYASPDESIPMTGKAPVKAIVIACNTATAYGLDLIQKAIEEWRIDVNVIGVIDAGAKSAVSHPNENLDKRSIGIMATEGTCSSEGYPRAVQGHLADMHEGSVGVIQQAGFGLAGAIDGDLSYIDPSAVDVRGSDVYQGPGLHHPKYPIDLSLMKEFNFQAGNALLIQKDTEGNPQAVELNSVTNYIRYYVTQLVIKALREYPGRTMDTVILGCTHYPFFEREINDHFLFLRNLDEKYAGLIPEKLRLIDPALSEAVELYEYLNEHELFGSNGYEDSEFYISVPNPLLPQNQIDEKGEFLIDYKYGRSINQSLLYVKRVPFSDRWMSQEVLERIRVKMPKIFEIIFKVTS